VRNFLPFLRSVFDSWICLTSDLAMIFGFRRTVALRFVVYVFFIPGKDSSCHVGFDLSSVSLLSLGVPSHPRSK
jgi:hypothetical protein